MVRVEASAAAARPTRPDKFRWGPELIHRLSVALLCLALAVRGWVLLSGYFYWDDFIFMSRAARLPLLSREYLTHAHDGHLMPAAFAATWAVERLAGLHFLLPATVMAAVQAGAWWAWYRLLVRLFGRRPLILAPLALVLFSPLAMPSAVWWAASLNGLPLQLGLIVGAHGLVSWLGADRGRGTALMVATTMATLLFFEKAVLLAPALFALAVVLAPPGPVLGSIRATLVDGGRLWLALFGITAAHVVLYLVVVGKQPAAPESWGTALSILGRGLVVAVLPTLVGGPLSWQAIGFGSAIAMPPSWLAWGSAGLFLLVVAATSWLRPRARLAWMFALGYVTADLLLFIAGRLGPLVDPAVVQGLRYTADAIVPIGLALGLALMPLVGEPETRNALAVRGWLGRHQVPVLISALVALDLFVSVSVVSQARYRAIWREVESRPWLAAVSASLEAAAGSAPLLAQPVPARVLYGLASPYNRTDWLLAAVRSRPDFADVTTELRLIDEDGALRPGRVVGPRALPGPWPDCGWLLAAHGGVINLSADVVPFEHTLRLAYTATRETAAEIRLGGGPPVRVQLAAGGNVNFVRLTGGGSRLAVSGLAEGADVCVDDAIVGTVELGGDGR